MLIVHHLNNSRSQRVLWLCEEIEAPYEIRHYQRDPVTQAGPPELKALHPLGKSPMITDRGRVIVESTAIAELILERYGNGALQPAPDSIEHERYVQWMHYAEGSGVFPFLLRVHARHSNAGSPSFDAIVDHHIAMHLGYLDATLARQPYLTGDEFTAADIQISFVAELAEASVPLDGFPHLACWLRKIQDRPAYRRAVEKGGPYAFNFFGNRETAES